MQPGLPGRKRVVGLVGSPCGVTTVTRSGCSCSRELPGDAGVIAAIAELKRKESRGLMADRAGTYRAVMATKKDAPEDLRVVELRVELPVEVPGPGQLRVLVRAAGVGLTDFMVLAGYEIAGVVDDWDRCCWFQGGRSSGK